MRNKAPLEVLNAYGGTVLGCAVWSAVHESKPDHLAIIQALIDARANVGAVEYPSGDQQVDEVLSRSGAAE